MDEPRPTTTDALSPRAGSLYERLGQPEMRPAWELLQRVKIQRGERVMVFPAATGEIACWIASVIGDTGRVVAADADPDRVADTRATLEHAGHVHGHAMAGDPAHMGRVEGFDVVFSHATGPLVRKLADYLDGVRVNLRPGGRFAIQIPAAGFCPDLTETVDECLSLPPFDALPVGDPAPGAPRGSGWFASRFAFPSSGQLEETIKSSGFRECDVAGKLYVERFETIADAMDFFRVHCLRRLRHDLGDEHGPLFMETLRARLIERLRRTEDLEIVFRRLFAYGRR